MEPAPRLIDWAVTSRCNLTCRHCRGMPGEELAPERAAALVEEIAALQPGWVIVEGGEPLLREELWEILGRLRGHGLTVHLITNGLLLDEAKIRSLKALGVKLVLSLDGARAATYESIRTGASFAKALAAARLAAAAGVLDALDMAILRRNFREIPEMFALARSLGAKLNLIGLKPCHQGQQAELLTPPEYIAAVTAACQAGRETGVEFFFDEPFFHAVARAEKLAVPGAAPDAGIGAAASGCIFGEYIFIETNGDVRPCSFAPLVLGNVKTKSLPAIWQDMLDSPLLREIKNPARRGGPCRDCGELAAACRGCRSRSFLMTGDWLAADPACPYVSGAPLKETA